MHRRLINQAGNAEQPGPCCDLSPRRTHISALEDSPILPQCCDSWDCIIGNTKRHETVVNDDTPPASRYPGQAPPTPPKDNSPRAKPFMSGLEVVAVVGCVAALCSAYHDGAELVQHIKAKRKARKTLKKAQVDETTQELEVSLHRGEGIIRSQFDRDFRRFGESFASGDQVARDALKDIIIHLQQQVIMNLKIHWQQDTFVDFSALQDVSDSSQDRCILVLMRLQQRIVTQGSIENLAPPPLNIPNAYQQRSLPALPALPQANAYHHAAPQAYMDPHPGNLTTLATSPIEQPDSGFAFTAPPSRQNTGPLTPPHSPQPQTGSQTQGTANHASPLQSPSIQQYSPNTSGSYSPALSGTSGHQAITHQPNQMNAFQFPQSQSYHTHYPPPPSTYGSVSGGNPYATDQASTSQFSLVQPNQSVSSQSSMTQPVLGQYSAARQPSAQYPPARKPVNFRYEAPVSFGAPAPTDASSRERKASSPSSYKPLATTTEKTSFFGIRKKRVERVPEPPENPLVDQYLAAAMQDENRSTSAGKSNTDSRSPSRSSQYDADHPNFNPGQQSNHSTLASTFTNHSNQENSPTRPTGQIRPSFDSLRRAQTQQSHHSSNSNNSNKSNNANARIEVLASNRSINSINPKDLLPNELNQYSGFCKGAWRQQIGDRKKAMEDRVRPGGMYNASKYLQCKSCRFEGRHVASNKKQNCLDMRVFKLVEGIQFRWEFLFKSHMQANNDGTDVMKGTFGCMFCCAEGRGTLIFEGVSKFMEHLVEHRSRLPTGEVLYRMNCLVGRTAGPDEDFDINIASWDGAAF